MWVGPMSEVLSRQAAMEAGVQPEPFDFRSGYLIGGWPSLTSGWERIVPSIPWHRGGQGILAEFDHRGAKVVAYEYVETDDEGVTHNKVTYHCQFCHTAGDAGEKYDNDSAFMRHLAVDQARKHVEFADRPGYERICRPFDRKFDEVIALAAGGPIIEHAAYCAAENECATIRNIRTAQALSAA
jgi:hypothetical protein